MFAHGLQDGHNPLVATDRRNVVEVEERLGKPSKPKIHHVDLTPLRWREIIAFNREDGLIERNRRRRQVGRCCHDHVPAILKCFPAARLHGSEERSKEGRLGR